MKKGDFEKIVFGLFFGLLLAYVSRIATLNEGEIYREVVGTYANIVGIVFGIFFYKTLHERSVL